MFECLDSIAGGGLHLGSSHFRVSSTPAWRSVFVRWMTVHVLPLPL